MCSIEQGRVPEAWGLGLVVKALKYVTWFRRGVMEIEPDLCN